MSRPPPPRGGIAGPVFLLCLVAAGAGFAFDLGLRARPDFWVGAEPAAAAVIGAVAALFAILAARVAPLVLRRRGGGGR